MMPKLPNLSHFPISLRDRRVPDPRPRELLIDYENGDLFVVTDEGELKSLSKDIFDSIVSSKLGNITLNVVDSSDNPMSTDPPLTDRAYNSWYFIITKKR